MEEENPGLGVNHKTIDNVRWSTNMPITYFDRSVSDTLTNAISEVAQTKGFGNLSDFQAATMDICREIGVNVNRNFAGRGLELTRVNILGIEWTEESATRAREMQAQKGPESFQGNW